MRACIHRGAHQIGGSCVELEAHGKRILIDLGMPLDAKENVPELLPAIPGLLEPSDSLLGVLLSHPHADHFGLLAHVRKDLPVAMGADGRRILKHAAPWMGRGGGVVPNSGHEMKDQVAFEVGPFRITPYLVDHSAYDAYALMVESDGRRVFYSGDFRGHGRKARCFERLLKHPPKPVHKLLMEGSSLGRLGMDERFQTEDELRDEMARAFDATKGFALVCASSQNIDRMVTIFLAARDSGRSLIIDLYTASVLEATGNKKIPQSHWDAMKLYVPAYQMGKVEQRKWYALLNRHNENQIHQEDLAAVAPRAVLLLRDAHREELTAANALKDARLFYSMWEGYLKEGSGLALRAWADAHSIPMQPLHTSGHASPADLKRFVHALDPAALVPIHTFQPERYGELFPRVETHEDGEWWEV